MLVESVHFQNWPWLKIDCDQACSKTVSNLALMSIENDILRELDFFRTSSRLSLQRRPDARSFKKVRQCFMYGFPVPCAGFKLLLSCIVLYWYVLICSTVNVNQIRSVSSSDTWHWGHICRCPWGQIVCVCVCVCVCVWWIPKAGRGQRGTSYLLICCY